MIEFHHLISCECLLLFTDMSLKCEHGSDGIILGQSGMVVPMRIILLCAEVSSLCNVL